MLHFSFYNFKVQERDVYEYYLNQKAQKGYELQWFNDFVHCFKKTNQQKHYYVDYNRNVKLNGHRYLDEEQQKQIEFYESNGYHFECNYKYFIVYSSETQLPPLHTDDEVEQTEQDKSYKSNILMNVFIPILLFITSFIYFILVSQLFQTVLNNKIMYIYFGFSALSLPFTYLFEHYSNTKNKSFPSAIKYICIRTWLYLFFYSSILISLFVLLYVKGFKIILYYSLFYLIFGIVHQFFLSHTLSLKNSTIKHSLIVLLIVIVPIFDILINDGITKTGPSVNIFDETITGKIIETNVSMNESTIFVAHTSCSFQTERYDEFSYDYYDAHTNTILKGLKKTVYNSINIDHTIWNGFELYTSYPVSKEVREFVKYPDYMSYLESPYILIQNNNEIIEIRSSETLSEDTLNEIIYQLGWLE